MQKNLHIKEANNTDRDFIIKGLMHVQEHEVTLHDTRKHASYELLEKYFEEIQTNAHEHDGALLLGCIDETPIGFVCFWIKNDSCIVETDDSNRYAYISDIYVVSQHRGKGFAQQMLQDVENRIKKNKSVKRLRVCTLAMNSLAIGAYQRAEFQPYEMTYEKVLF